LKISFAVRSKSFRSTYRTPYRPHRIPRNEQNPAPVAAAYAFHIAESQCFLDGNIRTAVAAALNFLAINDVRGRFDDLLLYDYMIGIAEK
jgi:hypothetical protein